MAYIILHNYILYKNKIYYKCNKLITVVNSIVFIYGLQHISTVLSTWYTPKY